MRYGCMKEIEDKRDYKLKVAKISQLPTEHQIKMPNVKNQGHVNSCVAHSLSTFMEEYYKSVGTNFSVGFIYGYRPEGYYQGEGMYPREALKTLQKIGTVKHSQFPYNMEIPKIKELVDNNISSLKKSANDFRVKSYARIYTEDEIKNCLINDTPVPISIPVYNNLKRANNNVVLPPEGRLNGYHMVILYGWNEDGFLFQNSWGENWGNKGRAILPYDYPIDSAWAISTRSNKIETKETIIQKIVKFLSKIWNIFR